MGQAAIWVMAFLARVLSALYFVLGPLARTASIPKASGTGGRWFRTFVTLLCWPLCSGVLLSLTLGVGRQEVSLRGVSSAVS